MNANHTTWISALALVACAASAATPFVDPDGIGAESPDMLEPERIVSACRPGRLWISLNHPIVDARSSGTSPMVDYPLTRTASTHAVSCEHGGHEIHASLDIYPPGDRGTCSATFSIKLTARVNGTLVIASPLANYCTGWGVTSISFDSEGDVHEFRSLTVCGYWWTRAEVLQRGGGFRAFRCEKLPLEMMMDKGLSFAGGEIVEHKWRSATE